MIIRINKCTDPGAWYASRVGQTIAVERVEINRHPEQGIPEDVYWCREGGTYNCINYVRKSDATEVDQMNPRILICIPCHNRWRIAEQCIPTVREGMRDGDVLNLYNDGSEEYTRCFLSELGANNVHISNPGIGIERQRAMHFRDFDPEKFTHLYLTDSDALHDPEWRGYALALQERVNFAPVCLYNTEAHVRLKGNTIQDDRMKPYILRRVAPGISYLLTAEHVAVVQRALPEMPAHWHWDWTVPMLLGNAMVVSRQSRVDHIGLGGMHHPKDEGYDGGDRAIDPTPWLVQKRKDVVAKLCRAL